MQDDLVELYAGYIRQGKPLVLPLYSEDGLLLANKGVVLNEEQFEAINRHDTLLTPRSELIASLEKIKLTSYTIDIGEDSAFKFPGTFERLFKLEKEYLEIVSVEKEGFAPALLSLVKRLDRLVLANSNASLAKIFLRTTRYASIEVGFATAILGALCTQELEWRDQERHLFMCAALTMELGLLFDPDASHILQLESTRAEIIGEAHIHRSVALLIERNVNDAKWLNYILNHHANDPRLEHTQDEAADQGMATALMIFIHNYCQMVTGYGYEQFIFPNIALAELSRAEDCRYRRTFVKMFLKLVGGFPAGGIVALNTGEIALVQKQGMELNKPHVRILIDKQGRRLPKLPLVQLGKDARKIRDMYFDAELVQSIDFASFWR